MLEPSRGRVKWKGMAAPCRLLTPHMFRHGAAAQWGTMDSAVMADKIHCSTIFPQYAMLNIYNLAAGAEFPCKS